MKKIIQISTDAGGIFWLDSDWVLYRLSGSIFANPSWELVVESI